MAYTETTTKSWGSRLGDSIKGIIVGIILFIVSFPLLFWNEGNSVKVAKALEEGRGATVEVADINKIDSANDGKLVHMTGDATTQDVLKDAEFGIEYNGMMLQRNVEFYQWVEKSHEETKKNFGGSETTVTTYTYSKDWCNKPVNSTTFKEPGHDNIVSYPVSGREQYATNVQYGAFKFTQDMIEKLSNKKTYSLAEYKIPAALRGRACVADKFVYVGRKTAQSATPQVQEPAPQEESCSVSPTDPQIGDVRITWEVISPKEAVSIVYVQTGDTFTPYHAKSDRSVALLGMGIQSAEQLYEHAEDMNTLLTWVLRLLGWFLMFCGLNMILTPLSVLGDVVPFIGSLIGGATSVVTGLISLTLALITISIAWIWYRPLLGIGLLAAAVFCVYLLFKRRKKPVPADAERV